MLNVADPNTKETIGNSDLKASSSSTPSTPTNFPPSYTETPPADGLRGFRRLLVRVLGASPSKLPHPDMNQALYDEGNTSMGSLDVEDESALNVTESEEEGEVPISDAGLVRHLTAHYEGNPLFSTFASTNVHLALNILSPFGKILRETDVSLGDVDLSATDLNSSMSYITCIYSTTIQKISFTRQDRSPKHAGTSSHKKRKATDESEEPAKSDYHVPPPVSPIAMKEENEVADKTEASAQLEELNGVQDALDKMQEVTKVLLPRMQELEELKYKVCQLCLTSN